jgi:hypothetical protein
VSSNAELSDYSRWQHWVTDAGAQAAAITAILFLIGYLIRLAIRMRRSTKEAFAEAVGVQVTKAIEPFADRLEQHENRETSQMSRIDERMLLLEVRVKTFIDATTALHQDLRAHMAREEERNQ